MKVFVLVSEPYHDTGEVVGVYSSVEAAQTAWPILKWRPEPDRHGWYTYDYENRITEHEIDGDHT